MLIVAITSPSDSLNVMVFQLKEKFGMWIPSLGETDDRLRFSTTGRSTAAASRALCQRTQTDYDARHVRCAAELATTAEGHLEHWGPSAGAGEVDAGAEREMA